MDCMIGTVNEKSMIAYTGNKGCEVIPSLFGFSRLTRVTHIRMMSIPISCDDLSTELNSRKSANATKNVCKACTV